MGRVGGSDITGGARGEPISTGAHYSKGCSSRPVAVTARCKDVNACPLVPSGRSRVPMYLSPEGSFTILNYTPIFGGLSPDETLNEMPVNLMLTA